MENELYHHGVKGQRWGIRRYQNKDGSLTAAGKKRAAKLESDYSELTGKKIGETSVGSSGNSSKSSKPKSISEMSNEEIQARIDRIGLENKLLALTPEHVSTGKKIVNGLRETAMSIAKEKGTKIVGDYVDKKVRNKLGLVDTKSMSKMLQEKAQDYENRQKIDRGEKYFKEGKYAEKKTKDNNKTNSSKKEGPLHGTVEGEGTSKRTTSNESRRTNRNEGPIDVEWREVNSENVDTGRTFVTALLEDRNRR